MTVLNEEGKILNLEGPSDGNHKAQKKKTPWWIVALQVTGLIILLIILGYFVIFDNVQKIVESAANNFHWMYGWGSGVVAFVVAALIARPIYVSLGRAFVWKLRTRDYVIFSICIVSIIASSYFDRNKFFAKGAPQKELCPALMVGDMPTVKGLGFGADEGINCIALTRKEAALAVAMDRSKIPKELQPRSLFELDALEPFSNTGAIAIYIGEAKGVDLKIYDGPGFNPRRLGILLPITEDQLIAYKATQRVKILGEMNAVRLQKEQEARAAVELAERQRAAAEAEARRLQQERLAAEAAEQRRIEAENQKQAEEKRKVEAASNARTTWWTVLLVLVVVTIGAFAAHPIAGVVAALILLIHLTR